MRRVSTMVVLLAASTGAPVAAQVQTRPDYRVELLFGVGITAGLIYSYNEGIPRSSPVYHVGGALWLNEHWGIALQHAGGVGHAFTDRYPRHGYYHDGFVNFRFSTLTARYRVFLDDELELAMGVGAQVAGAKWWHLTARHPPDYMNERTRVDLGLSGPMQIDERRRASWDGALALEFLVGRRLSRRLGIKGGVTFHGGAGSTAAGSSGSLNVQPVFLMSVSL